MSSAAATTADRGRGRDTAILIPPPPPLPPSSTFWCHECDVGVTLFRTSSPLCPHCRGDFLEEMELHHPFSFSDDDEPYLLSPPPPPPPFDFHGDYHLRLPLPLPLSDDDEDDVLRSPPPPPPLSDDHDVQPYHPLPPPPPPEPNSWDFFFNHELEDDRHLRPLYIDPPGRPSVVPRSAIDAIPLVQITGEFLAADPQLLCAVCKDEFALGSEAKRLPCKHVYHGDCIVPWLSLHNSCPLCRFRLPVDEEGEGNRTSRTGIQRRVAAPAVTFGNLLDDGEAVPSSRASIRRRLLQVWRWRRARSGWEASSQEAESSRLTGDEIDSMGGGGVSETVAADNAAALSAIREALLEE